MRVVIAEDLVLLRQSVSRMLAHEGIDVVAEAGDAAALVGVVVEHRPDLVISDVRMPPTFTDEGARAVLLLRQRFPDLAVLVLSHVVEPALAMSLVADRPAGFGYLLKDRVLDLDGFVAAVREVGAGGTAIDEHVVQHYLRASTDPHLAELTDRERDVLALVAQGLSNVAVAERLVVSERTVDSHLRSIFAKLGLVPSADENRRVRATLAWLAATADGSGLSASSA